MASANLSPVLLVDGCESIEPASDDRAIITLESAGAQIRLSVSINTLLRIMRLSGRQATEMLEGTRERRADVLAFPQLKSGRQ